MVTKENMGDNVGQGGQMGKSGRHERCIDFLSFSLFFFFQRIMYVHRVLGAAWGSLNNPCDFAGPWNYFCDEPMILMDPSMFETKHGLQKCNNTRFIWRTMKAEIYLFFFGASVMQNTCSRRLDESQKRKRHMYIRPV